MFKSMTNGTKPLYIRALSRYRYIPLYSTPRIPLFQNQYRLRQLGSKSQSRSQSTLNCNPSIDSINSFDNNCMSPMEMQYKIQTFIKTPLDDALIPCYLSSTYWWAYINPNAVKFWERQWLVDAILWGNFNRLKNEAIQEINTYQNNGTLSLNIAQIACVYGNFSTDLISNLLDSNGACNVYDEYNYKIIDIAPIQLINAKTKIDRYLMQNTMNGMNGCMNIDLYQNDSMNMELMADNGEDISYLFFLLHEQPKDVRLKTIMETIRITKKNGGKIVIIDYHKPVSNINPFRFIMRPILTYLEPFAIDLWNEQITDYVNHIKRKYNLNISIEKQLYFDGLYQKIVLIKH